MITSHITAFLLLATLTTLLPFATAKIHNTTIDSLSSFVYVTRFVFTPVTELAQARVREEADSQGVDEEARREIQSQFGYMEFDVYFPVGTKPQLLLYFDNSFTSWDDIYNSKLDCSARREQSGSTVNLWESSQIVRDVGTIRYNGVDTVRSTGWLFFTSITPKWFFVVIANCAPIPSSAIEDTRRCEEQGYCQGPTQLEVNLLLTNGDHQSIKHFSYDEQGLSATHAIFLVLQALLFILTRLLITKLLSKNKYHVTVQLLSFSVSLGLISHFAGVVYYQVYAARGHSWEWVRTVSSFAEAGADLVLVYLLIFLAKGWTLVRYKISSGGRLKITLLITLTFFCELAVQIWKSQGYNSALVIYLYATPPGILLLWLRGVTFAWFVYCCVTTMRSFTTKRKFFRKFSIFFGLWLVLKPVFAIICDAFVSDVFRLKFTIIFNIVFLFFAQVSLVLMYMPELGWVNKGFPFHDVSSVMLGLVQGQSASQFLEQQSKENDEGGGVGSGTAAGEAEKNGGTVGVSVSGDGKGNTVHSLGATKRILKDAGLNIHRSLVSLGEVGDDLITRLRDLDDWDDNEDVDFNDRGDYRQSEGGD